MSKRSAALTKALISFHIIYFLALGSFALFFTEIMTARMTNNITAELLASNRYFGLMEIVSGLLLFDFLRMKSDLIKPLIYLLFISITSLTLMTTQAVAVGLGDTYFLFRLTLTLLITIALTKEILNKNKS